MLVLGACAAPPEGTAPRSEFGADAFWAAPLPSDHRLDEGVVDLAGLPEADEVPFVATVVDILDGQARGFGTTSGLFLPVTGPVDPGTLPDLAGSVADGASVFLLALDPLVPEADRLVPVDVRYREDASPFGPDRALTLLPLQGVPLRPRTRYAAVITTAVLDQGGDPLVADPTLWDLLHGRPVEGLSAPARETYDAAVEALRERGLGPRDVAGLAAFTTADPHPEQERLALEARSYVPVPGAFERTDVFDAFCVYRATVSMPVFQAGTPPYLDGGGGIAWDGDVPVLDHLEEARLFVTIPRSAMPAGGWPTAVMVRTGGGGDRPLVDRGVRDAEGNVAVPGTGPALHFARAGFAGISVDGPHGGVRNATGGDEQFLMFNVGNPTAMRDNLRQSALELALLPDVLEALSLDTSDCEGAGAEARFDTTRLALMGHSMGATIAPLVLGTEPRFGAAILSGAGGSWIENVVYKEKPLAVRPIAEAMLDYPAGALHEDDPALTLLQWAGEAADPPVWNPRLIREPQGDDPPRHVLMFQGIVDRYILPPIANASSTSLGLDLGGAAHDEGVAEIAAHRTAAEVLPYGGGGVIPLPASGNHDRGVTAVLVQYVEDGVEDGHEVMYQLPGPKHQIRCFLATFAQGVPAVVEADAEDAPCP